MYTKLKHYIESLRIESIAEERKEILSPLINYLQEKIDSKQPIRINCICTHNSRRSHLTQVWMQLMAKYYGVDKLTSYSAGTESTAVYPTIIKSLKQAGIESIALSNTANPVYALRYDEQEHPIVIFSKRMDHSFNPGTGYAAIMTCDSANEACPIVPGAEIRFPITYQDPKAFDDRPEEEKKYRERMEQIATEMKYVFSKLNQSL